MSSAIQPSQLKSSVADRSNAGPGIGAFALPAFDTVLTPPGRFLIAKTVGDVELVMLDGSTLVWTVTVVGVQPFSFTEIKAAGTTVLLANIVVGL